MVDLRLRLGLAHVPPTPATRILVLHATVDGAHAGVGLVAERVYEVAELDDPRLEPPPAAVGAGPAICLAGVGRRQGRLVMVLDLGLLFSHAKVGLPSGSGAAWAA